MHTRLTSQTVPAAFFPQGGARVRRRQVLLTQPLRPIRILLCATHKCQVLCTGIRRTPVWRVRQCGAIDRSEGVVAPGHSSTGETTNPRTYCWLCQKATLFELVVRKRSYQSAGSG